MISKAIQSRAAADTPTLRLGGCAWRVTMAAMSMYEGENFTHTAEKWNGGIKADRRISGWPTCQIPVAGEYVFPEIF